MSCEVTLVVWVHAVVRCTYTDKEGAGNRDLTTSYVNLRDY